MAQILDTLPNHCAETFLCSYVNATPKVQVVRISNIANWYFERVVFQYQNLLFSAPAGSELEIYTGTLGNVILLEKIACESLSVDEGLGIDKAELEAV